MEHSEFCENHKQRCPECEKDLKCLFCEIGGGSHYWCLECEEHGKYSYDTYGFELYKIPKKK